MVKASVAIEYLSERGHDGRGRVHQGQKAGKRPPRTAAWAAASGARTARCSARRVCEIPRGDDAGAARRQRARVRQRPGRLVRPAFVKKALPEVFSAGRRDGARQLLGRGRLRHASIRSMILGRSSSLPLRSTKSPPPSGSVSTAPKTSRPSSAGVCPTRAILRSARTHWRNEKGDESLAAPSLLPWPRDDCRQSPTRSLAPYRHDAENLEEHEEGAAASPFSAGSKEGTVSPTCAANQAAALGEMSSVSGVGAD